ncbi:hypothetical protein CGC20_14295 [Leishmania donovani]|uniref:C3H1-type domain-containing protein n=1 Tax=Leishmania donovani TaxID=5661 RepID=A0A504XJA6_LEIDO|nr:hypothetical protein CGC20_14295 [Leishmania donovani]
MSGLDSHGKAMGEAQSDRQMSSSSLTAASRATPNPAAADGGAAAHAGGSPVDNEMDEHVPPVIAHVRKNFGVLAPTIEPFIYRSGCLNKSVVDVYNNLSRNYIAIVDAALKQVGFEEFTMQMQIMLTQILSEEFGEDTEYLVNTILTYTGADSLFVSLLSKSMLDQVITYAQSIMSGNMYGMSYNMQSGGGGGGRGSEGVGNSYYRGAQQHHGYRGAGENGSSRDLRGSSVAASPPHQDGAAPQKPYRSSGLPPHSSDPGRERSSDDLRATSDVISQREESRDWGGGASVPPRGATATGGIHVDSSVGPRGGAAPMSGMGAGAASRTEVSVSRATSETTSGAGVVPRHTHHHFSSSTAAAAPAAKPSSMERGGMSGAPQHNLLPPRASPASSQPRVSTPGAPSVSQATTTSPMPTMGRGGPGIPMHHHHHHLGIGAMATNSAAASDWAASNSVSGSTPSINAAGQRTLTPPTPHSSSAAVEGGAAPRNMSAPLSGSANPPSATHSPPASEERVATIPADSTGTPAPETNLPANQASASTPAPARSPPATSVSTTSAPPPALRGLGRIPLHHHHHHMHLMMNKVDAASAPQRQPQPIPATAVTYLLTDVNIEELRGLKYVDFEKKLRGGIPLMLDRQRIRQVLSSSAAVQSQSSDNDDSATSSNRKTATSGVGAEEEEAGGSGLPRRPPAISTGVQSPVTSHHAVASPADASFSSPEKESDKREGGTKTGSPTTASGAPTSPVPASTPAPSPNSSYSPSTRNEDPEDSREEEQRRGSGRRGGKRGGLGRGGFSSSRVCRFFGTAEGCQYGDKCHYMHSK